jgi:signal peptidase II
MGRLKHLGIVVCTLLGCVGCDQTTKSLARDYLQNHAAISFLGDLFRLQYAQNPGGFLSVGATLPSPWGIVLFTLGGSVLVLAFLLYAWAALRSTRLRAVAACLICAGGLGNLTDRIRNDGYVVDFLNVGVGGLRTGIFNVADVALLAGVALLAVSYLPARRPARAPPDEPR